MTDDGNVNISLGGLSSMQKALMEATQEGRVANETEEAEKTSLSRSDYQTKEEQERTKKDVRNSRDRARRATKKQNSSSMPQSSNDGGTSKSASLALNSHLSNVSSPQIIDNINKPNNSAVNSDASAQNMSENIMDAPSKPGIGPSNLAIRNPNAPLANLIKSKGPLGLVNNSSSLLQSVEKSQKNVSPINQQGNQNNQQIPTATPVNSASQSSAGGSTGSGGGGTRPWYSKMQDSLDSIDNNIQKLLEHMTQGAGGGSGPRGLAERLSKSSDGASGEGGGIASAIGPLLGTIGMMIAAKFGGVGAQVLHAGADLANNAGNTLRGLGKGVADAEHVAGGVVEGAGKGAINLGELALSNMKAIGGKVAAENPFAKMSQMGQNVSEVLQGGMGSAVKNVASFASSGAGKVLSKVAGGAMLLGGLDAAGHAAKSYRDFRTGDQTGGSAEGIIAAGKIIEYGGPKDMLSHVPVIGKLAAKLPSPISKLANKGVDFVAGRLRSAAIAGAAEAAIGTAVEPGGGTVLGGVVGAGAGLILGQAAGHLLTSTGEKMESKEGRKFLGNIRNSHTFEDTSKVANLAGKLGDKVGLGYETAAIGGLAGLAEGGVRDGISGLAWGAKNTAHAAYGLANTAKNSIVSRVQGEVEGIKNGASAIGNVGESVASAISKFFGGASGLQGNRSPAAIVNNAQSNNLSVAQKAQAAVASNPSMAKSGGVTSSSSNDNSIHITIPGAKLTSENDGKKIASAIGDTLRRQQQQQQTQRKAQEPFSNVSPGGNFNPMGALSAGIAFITGGG